MPKEFVMAHARPLHPPVNRDRDPHEVSGDESPPAQTRADLTRGGGHRSGSRGAGTLENPDEKRVPHEAPKGTA